jgi:predicted permease
VLINVVIPVLVIMFSGYIFGKRYDIDPSTISKMTMVILSPALIFSFLVRAEISYLQLGQIVLSVLIFTIIMSVLTVVLFLLFKDRENIREGLIGNVFPNTGNFGLPVVLFAYGDEGFQLGVIIVVINFILMYSLGIFFASPKNSTHIENIKDILKLPTTFATILASIILLFQLKVPDFIFEPLRLVGDSMIPIAMILLGIYLANTPINGYTKPTLLTSILKVVVAPVVIILTVSLLGIDDTLAKVLIIQHAMPTAVLMSIIASEYKMKVGIVANATVVTTIASIFSITVLLYLLELIY